MPWLDSANQELPFQSGSATSRDAAVGAARFVGKQGEAVLHFIRWTGNHGCTQKEASASLTIARASVAARFNALELRGDIRKTDERREACAVYVASQQEATHDF
ncbi:MAG: hypothetical protein GEV06_19695 [Luteitalea sp.]|nr:hypothetical protein [Luteitalea sp.]